MSMDLAILASGSGGNVQAIIDAVARGDLDADIRVIISNRPQAYVLERAAKAGIPHLVLDHTRYPDRLAFDQDLVKAIREAGADTVALAGYMRLLTRYFLDSFPDRVVNVHPAILPAFKGVHGVMDAYVWSVKLTGCTVHFVSEQLDSGAVIIQAATTLGSNDPLEDVQARIHSLEHRIYPQALQWLAEGRLRLHGRRVEILPGQRAAIAPEVGCLINPPLEEGF